LYGGKYCGFCPIGGKPGRRRNISLCKLSRFGIAPVVFVMTVEVIGCEIDVTTVVVTLF